MGRYKLRWAKAKLLISLQEEQELSEVEQKTAELGFTFKALNLANVGISNRHPQYFLQQVTQEPQFEKSMNWMLPQLPFTLGLFLCLFVRKKQVSQRVKVETGVQKSCRNACGMTEWGGNCSGDSDQARKKLEREWRHAMQTGEPVKCLGGAKHSSSNILKCKIMGRGWEETTFRGTSTCNHTGERMLLIVSLSLKNILCDRLLPPPLQGSVAGVAK